MDKARRFFQGRPAGPRERLLDRLRSDPRLSPEAIDALGRVPRERFVDPADADIAYEDVALQIGPDATISAPSMVAEMLSVLDLRPGLRVLEVGAGSGYAAACLAETGASVVGLELLPELAERARRTLEAAGYGGRVRVIAADGVPGWPDEAPYDRILASAALDAVPQAWLDQLAADGLIVYPETGPGYDTLVRLSRAGGGWRREEVGQCRFVRMK